MNWHTWSIYVVTYLVVCITPGPAVLFITSQSAWRGRAAGVRAALGIETANVAFWILTALGLAAAIAASQTVFSILKWAGAGYLAWLGIRAIAGSFKREIAEASAPKPAAGRAYRDGLIVGLSNPKAMLFFVALLPQFVTPSANALPQILTLAITSIIVDFSSNAAYALAAGSLRRLLARGNIKRWFDRGIGGVFLSLAAVAALYRRAA